MTIKETQYFIVLTSENATTVDATDPLSARSPNTIPTLVVPLLAVDVDEDILRYLEKSD